MIQDVLSSHIVELLQAATVENKITWPGPIGRELVAEVQWLQDELSMRPTTTGHRQRGTDIASGY